MLKIKNELICFAIVIVALMVARGFVAQIPSWQYWNYPLRAYDACLGLLVIFFVSRIVWIVCRKKT